MPRHSMNLAVDGKIHEYHGNYFGSPRAAFPPIDDDDTRYGQDQGGSGGSLTDHNRWYGKVSLSVSESQDATSSTIQTLLSRPRFPQGNSQLVLRRPQHTHLIIWLCHHHPTSMYDPGWHLW